MEYLLETGNTLSEDELEACLLADLARINRQADNTRFTLSVREQDRLIAGLTASSSYGWLHIHTLWVAEQHRGQGIGSELLRRAEMQARTSGCHHVWLETSNKRAARLYEVNGYELFGRLANQPDQFPGEHERSFYRKTLQ